SQLEKNGARIRKEDAGGEIFIIYDTLDKRDVTHAKRILGTCAAAAVPAPFTGHNTIIQLSDTGGLIDFLKMAANNTSNAATLREVIRKTRTESLMYIFTKIEFLLDRYILRINNLLFIEKTLDENKTVGDQIDLYRAGFEFIRGSFDRSEYYLSRLTDEQLLSVDFSHALLMFDRMKYVDGLRRLLPL